MGGPAAVGGWDTNANELASRHCGAAATHTPHSLQRHPAGCEDADVEDTDSEAGDDAGDDCGEARPLSLLERVTAADAVVQAAAADVGAGSASAGGPGSNASDEGNSTEQDSIAAVAAGLSMAQCPAPSPAVSPDAATETAPQLSSEEPGRQAAAQEAPGWQLQSMSGEAAVQQAEVQLTAKQRQARRSPTRGGPTAPGISPSADATELPSPVACGPTQDGVVGATPCVTPEVSPADAEASDVEPRGGFRRQSSVETTEQPAVAQDCGPAAPDTPPSKPPPLAATTAAVDEAQEHARRKQQVGGDMTALQSLLPSASEAPSCG